MIPSTCIASFKCAPLYLRALSHPQGQVSDGNAFALGGIAGHAGYFSNVPDVIQLVARLMWAPAYSDKFINATTCV